MTSALSAGDATFGNPASFPIVATASQASPVLVDWDEADHPPSLPQRSADSADAPLIIWSDVDLFLSLLERTGTIHVRLYPRKKKDRKENSSETALSHTLNRKEGKSLTQTNAGVIREIEATLQKPEYQEHSLGIVINPGGVKKEKIREGRALFFEADGDLSLDEQLALPERIGLPAPTFSVWSGSRSVHHYWVGAPDEMGAASKGLPPAQWTQAQERLIAAVKEAAPECGVDEAIRDLPRVMRAPGGTHPATGERTIFLSELGELFDLAALVEMLPKPVAPLGPSPSQKRWEERTGELQNLADLGKATDALAYLPPEHFTGYMPWLGVGMALHSVTPALFDAWMVWSKGMGDAFDEEECRTKWETFSVEREDGLGLGSLIRLAKNYGYQPPAAGKDTSSRYTAAPSAPSAPSLPTEISSTDSADKPSRTSQRSLSVQERMELVRETVANLLQDGTTPLDRLPVLRERASELDLPLRDGELSKLVWEARRALTAPAEALSTGDLLDFTPIPWCWEGLLMREAVNLFIAAPKVGKTSLVIAAIAAWNRGETFLGKQFFGECPPVLLVGSDQPQSDWGRMLQKEGLVSEERRILAPIVGLFHSGTPLSLDPEGIEKIASYAKEHPGLLIVIDSYSRCVSSLGLSERDAEIAGPLADLQEAIASYGATIVVIHHANKGGHESASMASRGSSALPALASQLIHLTRLEQGQGGSMGGKRMLTTEGRGGAPEKMLLELSEEGQWLFRGDGDALLQEQERQKTVGSLNDRQAAALEHVEETWEGTKGGQGISADLLASLMELRGADTSRTARRLLEQLRERGLVKKVVQSEGKDRALVARYIPTASPEWEPLSVDSVDAIPVGADGKDGADGAADKREEVSLPLQMLSTESTDVSEFQSVETFRQGEWRNGWIVEKSTKTMAGTYFSVFRQEDPSEVASLHQDFVRPCAS